MLIDQILTLSPTLALHCMQLPTAVQRQLQFTLDAFNLKVKIAQT